MACLREHAPSLTTLDDAYVTRANEDKARDELRRKAEDGERYAAAVADLATCREWLKKSLEKQ